MSNPSVSLRSGGQHLDVLVPTVITAAAAGVVGPVVKLPDWCTSLSVLANLTYGSGGTTIDAWIQTSLDGGQTWMDIMNFHFTTASAKKAQNVIAGASVVASATPGDAAMAADTGLSGFIGDRIRVKYTSAGTYAGSTSLEIDAIAKSARPPI